MRRHAKSLTSPFWPPSRSRRDGHKNSPGTHTVRRCNVPSIYVSVNFVQPIIELNELALTETGTDPTLLLPQTTKYGLTAIGLALVNRASLD